MSSDWEPVPLELNELTGAIVDAAYRVHSQLGPGLLESVYETCLVHELRKRGLQVETQVTVPIHYDDLKLDAGLRLDIIVNGCVIVEVKSVLQMHGIFEAQLLTYLKLAKVRLGLLINFNVANISDGIRRKVR